MIKNSPLNKPNQLYHISFNCELEGIWEPKIPDDSDYHSSDKSNTEPNIPRISFAPTIEQCFQAIYPNISKYFEEENYPHMDFCVYTPILTGNEKIYTPIDLTNNHYVHDAHMTGEHCILDRVEMKKIAQIRIYNTNKSEFLTYHPFNDGSNEKKGFAPKDINWDIIKLFNYSINNLT